MNFIKITTGALMIAALSATGTVAADRLVSPPVGEVAGFDWDGFYAGVNASNGWGEFDGRSVDGLTLGGQVGYSMNLDGIIVGIEADYQDAGIQWRDRAGTLDTRAGIDHFGTVRGRLGVDLGNIMPYVTGGLAFGSLATRTDDGPSRSEESTYGLGWAAGGGVETLIADDLTLKAEYLYVDLPGFNLGGSSIDANAHTVRAGLNWHF